MDSTPPGAPLSAGTRKSCGRHVKSKNYGVCIHLMSKGRGPSDALAMEMALSYAPDGKQAISAFLGHPNTSRLNRPFPPSKPLLEQYVHGLEGDSLSVNATNGIGSREGKASRVPRSWKPARPPGKES